MSRHDPGRDGRPDEPPTTQPSRPATGEPGPTAVILSGVARLSLWCLRFLVLVATVVVLGWVLQQLWVVVLPVLLALLLCTVLWPPTRWARRVLPPTLAALAVVVGALLLGAGLVAVLVPRVVGQLDELTTQFVAGLEDVQGLVTALPLDFGEAQLGGVVDTAIEELQDNAQQVALQLAAAVSAVGSAVVTGVLAVVLAFFFLKDGPRFVPWLGGLLSPSAAGHLRELADRCWATLGGFIRSQALVGLVDAVFIGIGLAVLGVPLALPLAVLIFFAAFVPIVGAVVTGILAAVVALVAEGPTTALLVVVLVVVVQQLESNVLQPFLVGQVLRLHPVVILLSVTAGGFLFGVVGAFLAVPLVAVVAVVLRYVREVAGSATRPTPPAAAPGDTHVDRPAEP